MGVPYVVFTLSSHLILGKSTEGGICWQQTFSPFLSERDWRGSATDWADREGVSRRPSFHLPGQSISFSFFALVDALGCKKGKGPMRVELKQVICLFLSCMELTGSNVFPFPGSLLHKRWRSVFFQYECHRKGSCLPLFFSLALWFKLVKV